MKYKLIAPAYGGQVDDEVILDQTDPLVQLNVTAGVLEPIGPPGVMHCPACITEGRKRPTKTASQEELDAHYGEKHPALVAPEWKEEVN